MTTCTTAALNATALENPLLAPVPAQPSASGLGSIARYTGVNLLATTVDFIAFMTLVHAAINPTTSSILAYSLSILINYTLSRKFVFTASAGTKTEATRFLQFLATGALGLIITALVTLVGTGLLAMAPGLAKTAAVLVCFVVLYFVRSRLVFKA